MVLPRQHGIGLRAGGDEDACAPEAAFCALSTAIVPSSPRCWTEMDSADGMTGIVDLDGERRKAFGETDAFLQRLFHFLVVQRVRRAVDQALAIGDRGSAPRLQQLRDGGRGDRSATAFARSARIGARMEKEFLGDQEFVLGPRVFDAGAAAFLARGAS